MRRIVVIALSVMLPLVMVSGIAWAVTMTCSGDCWGTKEPDTIYGSAKKNMINSDLGEDYIAGKAAGDNLYGNRQDDEIHGNGGDDKIRGGKHHDTDKLYGEAGNDILVGVEEFSPSTADYLDCGDGNDDTAYVDPYAEGSPDITVNCENVIPAQCEDVYPSHLCPTPASREALSASVRKGR